jgi:hypothetical protein
MPKITKILTIFLIIFTVTSCGKNNLLKPDWSKTAEPDGKKRARQNVEEGKGIQLFKKDDNGGNFMFASSNPLWRASLEVVDFMVLSVVDYAGGVIITDWYNDENPNESIKITIKFLTNEIRSDALKININKKNCDTNGKCLVTTINDELNFEIKKEILKKAAAYKKEIDENDKIKNKRPESPITNEKS